MKPYDDYKETNIPWLNEYPEHWSIKRAKAMFSVYDERSKTGEEELLSVSSNFGVVKRKNINVTMFRAESYVGYKICHPDDLAVNSLWAWAYGLGFSKNTGIISTAYSVYRLKDKLLFNPDYYNYFVRSIAFQWELQVRSKGLWKSRYQMSDSAFMDSPILVPPRTEQDQIVRFLDWKVSRINKLIGSQKKQIELLNEQKQAIINKAVTKGLNENAPMKDSGIEWIGQLPRGWHIRPFSKVANVCSNLVHPQDNLGLPQISPASIEKNTGKLLSFDTVREAGIISDNHRFYKGQIIYSKIRPKLNKVTIAPFDGLCSADMYPIETQLVAKYLMYYMLSTTFLSQLTMSGNRVKMPKINKEELSVIAILFPDEGKQQSIVNYIDDELQKIDRVVDSLSKEIYHTEEYRNRLVSDVVTGKIDIRNIAVPEFEMVDEVIRENETELDELEVLESE